MRLNIIAVSFMGYSSIVATAYAQVPGVEKFKNYLPEQIWQMKEEERQSSVPMMYLFAARQGTGPFASTNATYQLSTLMYPAIHDLPAAIKLFQKDLGDSQTGKLTVSQLHKLQVRFEYQRLTKVGFPRDLVHTINSSYASVRGTRKILDDKISDPINVVEFKCYRSRAECTVTEVSLSLPTENSFAQMFNVHLSNSDRIKVTRWENEFIDGAYEASSDACRVTNVNFNFKTKEFFEITRNSSNDCEGTNKIFPVPKLNKPRIVQIIDGSEIQNTEFSKISETSYSYLSSDFRQKVEQIEKEQKK